LKERESPDPAGPVGAKKGEQVLKKGTRGKITTDVAIIVITKYWFSSDLEREKRTGND